MKNDFCREAIVAGVLVAVLAGVALADPWRQSEPGGLAAPWPRPPLPVGERHEPGGAFGSPEGSFRPGMAESTLPRTAGAPRSPGVMRAVEARGEPIVLRLGFQRMAQVQLNLGNASRVCSAPPRPLVTPARASAPVPRG